ncbi:MAG: hypothetical protein ACO4CW_07690 [Planctomycetota bacterium]
MVSLHPDAPYSCILETPDGLVLRVPVLRLDEREALLDSDLDLPEQSGFEVIVERSDGLAEVLHTEVQRTPGGLLLRWDFRHPSEMTSLDRLLETPSSPASGARDVPLDIEAALVQRTRMVRTSEIAAKRDTIRVLKLDTVRELIARAVDEALERSTVRVEETERDRILRESEERFRELLARAKAEKDGVEAQRSELQKQLDRARTQLEREKERPLGTDRFTLSDEAIDRIERRMHRYVDDSLAAGRADTTMESGLRTAIEGILDAERTRIEDLARSARSDRIELLEQKIHRLARSLEDTQQERDRARQRAHALETTAAKSPIVGVAAEPLDREDPQQGRKLALLADLVRENHDLRRRMEEQGRGIPRVPASPTPPAPATPRSP